MNTSFLSSPVLVTRTFHIFTILAVPIHLLGTYCILFKTPKIMESIKWSMFWVQLFSMLSDFILSVLVCPFMVLPAFAGKFLGVLSSWDVSPAIQVYLMFTAMFLVSAAVVSLFENRFYLLFASSSWWVYARYPFLIAQYIIALVSFLPAILLIPERNTALEVLQKKFPQIPLSQYSSDLFIISLNGYAPCFSIVITGNFTLWEVLIFCLILYLRFSKNLKQGGYSQKTYDLQKKFLNAILIQNSVPFITLVVPSTYVRYSMNHSYYNQDLNSLCMLLASLHGLTATIVMLGIHEPYRNVIIGFVF